MKKPEAFYSKFLSTSQLILLQKNQILKSFHPTSVKINTSLSTRTPILSRTKKTTTANMPLFWNFKPNSSDHGPTSSSESFASGSQSQKADSKFSDCASETSVQAPPPDSVASNADFGVNDPLGFLSSCDTVFLTDDSSSMGGYHWQEVAAALKAIVPICMAANRDGIDMFFYNELDERKFRNITSPDQVDRIVREVIPCGLVSPTGTRLSAILNRYLKALKRGFETKRYDVKALSIIVITDGRPTNDVASAIIKAAKELDQLQALPWQVGIQFLQVGRE